jgi:hypothetical protein
VILRYAGLSLALCAAVPLPAQVWRTLDASRAKTDSMPVALRVEYTRGRLHARPAASGNLLYDFRLQYDASRTSPLVAYDSTARRFSLGTLSRPEASATGEGRRGGEALLQLGRDAPLDLVVRLHISSGTLDLGGLALRGLSVDAWAGEVAVRFDTTNATPMTLLDLYVTGTTLQASGIANARAERVRIAARAASADVDLGGQWTRDLELDVDVTLGSVTIHVPSHVGIQLEARQRLSSIEAKGLTQSGEVHLSENWKTARYKLNIRVHGWLGNVDLIRDAR